MRLHGSSFIVINAKRFRKSGQTTCHYCTQQQQTRRRVVITGIGALTPLGHNLKTSWQKLISGFCAIQKLNEPEYEKLPCQIAAPLSDFNSEKYFKNIELKTMSKATVYAMVATAEALNDANWCPTDEHEKQRTGVAIGMGMVDLNDVCETYDALKKGYNRVSPFFVPRLLPNMAAGQISIKYGFQGPNHSVSTACATGLHALGDSSRFIQYGDADVMIAGGTEACINPISIAGFCRLRALSTSKEPAKASRPFDKKRDGFVMGEGSAIFVLEELNHALQRGANIYAEILGYGLSGDASHLTSPKEDGSGALLVMSRALKDAGVSLNQIGYINAHATSTPIGDVIEARAIKTLFKEHAKKLKISSSKGAHGHLLGAAGNLEAAFTTMAIKESIIPPTISFESAEDEVSDLNFVPNIAQSWESITNRKIALKNSFGFGGTNASLCIAEYR